MQKLNDIEKLIERAILVGVNLRNDEHFDYTMEELEDLAEALEVEVVGMVTQNLERVTPSHYIGTGKIEEVRNFYEEANANLVIFNDELSPSQIRNLERDLDCKVIDRTMLHTPIVCVRWPPSKVKLMSPFFSAMFSMGCPMNLRPLLLRL